MAEAFFTEQHELIRRLAHDFAQKELTKEVLDKVEETETFPEEILNKMAKAGFFGIKIPKELGTGSGRPFLCAGDGGDCQGVGRGKHLCVQSQLLIRRSSSSGGK